MELRRKVINGLRWVVLSNYLTKIITISGTIILARLLLPEDFGLIAFAILIFSFLESLSNFGVNEALIQKQKNILRAANSGFVISIILGLLYYIILFFSAPLFSKFFNAPILISIIRIASLKLVIDPFGRIHAILLQKELEFKKINKALMASSLAGNLSAIFLAITGFGVWSLVYGLLIDSLIRNILLPIMSPFRLFFKFHINSAKDLLDYGKHIVSAHILDYLDKRLDFMFVGKLVGGKSLGLYSLALKMGSIAYEDITSLTNIVLFPTYARIQNDTEKIKALYLKTIKLISFFTIPLMLGLLVLAPSIVNILLGEKWQGMVLTMRILCIYGLLRSIDSPLYELIKGTMKPKIIKYTALLNLFFLLIFIYPLTITFGMEGTAMAVLISLGLSEPLLHLSTFKKLKLPISSFLKILYPQFLSGIIMITALYLSTFLVKETGLLGLVTIIIFGCSVYASSVYLLKKTLISEVQDLIKTFIGKQNDSTT